MQSDAKLTFPPRMTASSGIVTSKPSSKVVDPNKESKVSDSEQDGGRLLAEDDSREREMAMSSPMKGFELRSTKVCHLCVAGNVFIPFQSLVKVKSEKSDSKPRKRATVQDLAMGANEDSAWTRLVVPNFINIILADEQPWVITDGVVIAKLQLIWDHVYGMKVQFTIEKGTAPFELVSLFDTTHCTNSTYFSLGTSKAL